MSMAYASFGEGDPFRATPPTWEEVAKDLSADDLFALRLGRDFSGMLGVLGLGGEFTPHGVDGASHRSGGDHWSGTYTTADGQAAPMQLHANDPGRFRPNTARLGARIFWNEAA